MNKKISRVYLCGNNHKDREQDRLASQMEGWKKQELEILR